MKKILIVGATSAIATACARLWAAEKAEFFLAARDPQKLRQTADDLKVRGAAAVHSCEIDLNRFDAQPAMLESCFVNLGRVDIVLVCYGTLPDQQRCEQDSAYARQEFSNNGSSTINLLGLLAGRMEQQRAGVIAVVSSVAGERGRRSNYLYGSAKAAVTAFCAGVRLRLLKSGVNMLTVKPGFVDTPMTAHLALPQLLTASPEAVAKDIKKAIEKRKGVVYTPWYWAFIMFIIRCLPELLFRRLPL
jgi:decaprenylphospho-beta-D-erythro-pentofuranosid-2-ulose 2-reductase